MSWIDTDKYKVKRKVMLEKSLGSEENIKYLEALAKEKYVPRMPKKVPKFVSDREYARCVSAVDYIDPSKITFTGSSGHNCQNCGLYNRHCFCSPDTPEYRESEKIIKSYKHGIVFVSQNDGTLPWRLNPLESKHVTFEKKHDFGLKGTEAGTSRYLQGLMKQMEYDARKQGYRAQAFITGHCEMCGRCPVKSVKDNNGKQVSCPLGGLPSLETWWIDVYRWYSHGELNDVFKRNSEVLQPMTFI